MTFKELQIGDTFDKEQYGDSVKFIKIVEVWTKDGFCGNAVCIDEYSDSKGSLFAFHEETLVSHVNYS